MNDKTKQALELALKRAFNLGQTYWQQVDSEYQSHWKKGDVTLASFNQLVEDTIREALEQPAQEPVAFDVRCDDCGGSGLDRTDNNYRCAVCDGAAFVEKMLYTSPPRKPLTDEQLQEIADKCRLYPRDFARAIEAAHGIKGEA